MNIVPALPAAVAGVLVFFVPGLLFLALLPKRERDEMPPDEALFLIVSVSVATSAWLALALAEAGRFSLTTAAALLALAAFVAVLLGRRRLLPPLRRPRGWSEILPALVVLTLALCLQARPSEYLLGGRDPGTYIATMGIIGRTGGIAYVDPGVRSIPSEDVELFYRHPQNPDFSWGRFMGFPLERPQTGRVFPEFFHLFPAFGAYLFQAMGVKGALATPPIFGILGTLGVFFAFRRILGPGPALLAALLLGLNVIQVWFARYPVAEPVSQFLIFLAFLAVARWEERGSAAFGALAGAALGLSLLVRIDSVLLVVPIALYLIGRRVRGDLSWRAAWALLVPFLLLAGHAAFHASFWARKYLLSIANRPYWRQPPEVWAAAALTAVAAVVVASRVGPRIGRWLESHGTTLRVATMLLISLLSLYAYFVRPLLSAWAGGDGNDRADALAHPGILASLGFTHLAAHDAQAFVRLGWFVTPVGLALGVLGLLSMIGDWRERYLFPVLTALTFAGFYFYKIRVFSDYYFAMRRFMPVILPCLLGFAALLVWRGAERRGWRRLAAGALAVGLGGAFFRATLPIARYVDWKNAVRFVDDVARRFGPNDVVIFEQVQSIHLLSLPLWAVHGVNIIELARFNPDPERLRHLVDAWRSRYKNIYFVHTYRTDLCGLFLQRVEDYAFGTQEWERAYGRPPRRAEPRALRFTLSRVVPPAELKVPPLPEVDVGGSDDFQISGFFDKEGGGDKTYRWTGSCASIYVPGARPGAQVVLTASAGRRPESAGSPQVRVSLSGTRLGEFRAVDDWSDHAFELPDPLPSGAPVLRLDVPAWRPINALPDSSDVRDLGVMIDRIRIEQGGAESRPPEPPSHSPK